jgi:TRAP-type C4-dicarboxylate transport system permease small subunit
MSGETVQQDQATSRPGAMDRLARLANAIAAAALCGLVLVQAWQVIARYVLNDSPSWTEPVTVLLLSTTMGMAAAAAVHERRHFAFNLLADSLAPAARGVLQIAAVLAIASIGAIMAWWGSVLFFDGLHIRAAGARLPQGAGYLPLAAGGALMTLFAINLLSGLTRQPRGGP